MKTLRAKVRLVVLKRELIKGSYKLYGGYEIERHVRVASEVYFIQTHSQQRVETLSCIGLQNLHFQYRLNATLKITSDYHNSDEIM